MHQPYIPDGCDQQGRIQAAESATDIGADYSQIPAAEYRALWRALGTAIALVAAVAAVVWNADLVAWVRAAGAL